MLAVNKLKNRILLMILAMQTILTNYTTRFN